MQVRQGLFAAAATLALPMAAAQAQVSGLYIGLGAMGSSISEMRTNSRPTGYYYGNTGTNMGHGFRGSFGLGAGGVASLGYGLGNGLRAELEGFYRANGVDSLKYFTSAQYTGNLTSTVGTLRNYGVMANLYYDVDPNYFPEGMRFFQPYVGLGIGYGYMTFQGVHARASASNNGNQNYEVTSDKSGGNLAYQAIIGAAFAVDSVAPGLAVTTEYRYFGQLSTSIGTQTWQTTTNNQTNTRTQISTDSHRPRLSGHALVLGLRYALDTPAAPGVAANLPVGWSAPAAAAPAARTYMVFFGNNSAALDAAARQVIGEAVQSARTQITTSISLQGHADGTGRGPRNQALSEQRVRAVTGELVRLGVPRNAITGLATGAAGSAGADAQARRVDILLR